MSAAPIHITDEARFNAAMRRGAHSVRRFNMRLTRLRDSAGDRHIERILRDCGTKRQDVETTARRLMVASDIAQVLDGPRCEDCQRSHAACRCEQDVIDERNAEWWAS